MPRTLEANQQLRDTQRTRLLQAAGQAFARKGRAVTMSDIAQAAGVSQGLAYRYFPSKEALLAQVLEHGAQTRLGAIERVLNRPGTPGQRLEFFITKSLENLRDQTEFYQLSASGLDEAALPDDLRRLLRQQVQAYQDALRQLIIAGQASGEVAAGDPEQLMILLTAIIGGLARQAAQRPEAFRQHFPAPELVLRVIRPAAGQAEANR